MTFIDYVSIHLKVRHLNAITEDHWYCEYDRFEDSYTISLHNKHTRNYAIYHDSELMIDHLKALIEHEGGYRR